MTLTEIDNAIHEARVAELQAIEAGDSRTAYNFRCDWEWLLEERREAERERARVTAGTAPVLA